MHPSDSASEEFWKAANLHAQTRFVKMTLPLVLKQLAAAEHHRRSQRGQAELKGRMAPIIMRRQSIFAEFFGYFVE